MPSARAALEKLKWLCDHGRENEKVHVVFVEEEQKERIKNKKRKTRFVLVCTTPEICAMFEFHKDRVFRRTKNKVIMEHLMLRAWSDALSDREIDKILAMEEGMHEQENSAT